MTIFQRHPVTSPLFGVGFPACIGFALAGWPLALIVATVIVAGILMGKS